MERLRLVRALSVTGSGSSLSESIDSPSGDYEDLGMDLIDLWKHGVGGWQNQGCLSSSGGWCAEAGGHPDLVSTVCALGFVLDSGISAGSVVTPGLRYVSGWLDKADAWDDAALEAYGIGPCSSSLRRLRLESLVVLALGRRDGRLEASAEDRLESMVRAEMVSIGSRLKADTQDVNAGYDDSLLLRASKLLGIRDGVEELEQFLLASQKDDGTWEDETAAGTLVVTCAAVEALSGLNVEVDDLSVAMSFCGVDGEVSEDAGITSGALEFTISRSLFDGARFSVSVRAGTGGSEGAVWNSAQADTVAYRTDNLAPGEYEAVIRVWDEGGNVQLWEGRKSFVVQPWFRFDTLEISSLGIPSQVRAGSAVTLSPRIVARYGGNESKAGRLDLSLADPGGEALAASGDVPFEMPRGVSCAVADIQPMVLNSVQAGYHTVTAKVYLDGTVFTASRLFHADAACELSVENYLEPAELPDGETDGTVVLTLHVENLSAESGIAASFDGVSGRVSDCEDGGLADMVLTNIVTQDGKALDAGWLVLKSDYGRCIGGEAFGCQPDGGSVTLHAIVDGICRFSYCGNGHGLTGTVALRVHAAAIQGDVQECLDEIGVVEINLN